MTIEQKLRNYPILKVEINKLKLELEYFGITSHGDDVKPSTPTYAINSVVENQVINMEQQKQLIKNKEVDVQIIENALTILSEQQRELVKLRYFQGLTQDVVAHQMRIGVKTVYAWSKKILKVLEPLI